MPSSDLPAADQNGFAARYRAAKPLFLRWQQAEHEHRHEVSLPAAFSHAWMNALARAVFGGVNQFREPADLLALAQAVREMACEGVTPGLGRGIDTGDAALTVYEFESPVPQSPRGRVLGHHVPHIDDALHLLGERSRSRLADLVVGWFDWWHLLAHLNGRVAEKLELDPWIRRYAFRADGGPFAGPQLVRPLPWPEPANEPFEPLRLPRDPFADNRWDRGHTRLAAADLPQWRRRLVSFCREAVYELAHRGYPVDPLPVSPAEGGTFEELADQLLVRANQAVRHAGGGPIEPIPGWHWWFRALPPRGAYARTPETPPSLPQRMLNTTNLPVPPELAEGPDECPMKKSAGGATKGKKPSKGKEPSPARARLIAGAIRDAGKPLATKEIRAELKLKGDGSLPHHLSWMVADGRAIVKLPGKKGYWLAGVPVPEVA